MSEPYLPFETVRIYEWSDIESVICEKMGIEENKFRDYHNVVGGKYKDLWHEILYVFEYAGISNDRVVALPEIDEDVIEELSEDTKWKKELYLAWNEIYKEIVMPGKDEVYVRFYW